MSWPPQPPGGPPRPQQGWGQPSGGPPANGWAPTQPVMMQNAQLLPDRSAIILVLSLSSLMALFIGCTACGPLALVSLGLSVPAIVMARKDLAAIQAGQMVASGRDATNVGMIIAIVSTVISVLVGVLMILLMVLYGGLIGAALITAAVEGA